MLALLGGVSGTEHTVWQLWAWRVVGPRSAEADVRSGRGGRRWPEPRARLPSVPRPHKHENTLGWRGRTAPLPERESPSLGPTCKSETELGFSMSSFSGLVLTSTKKRSVCKIMQQFFLPR